MPKSEQNDLDLLKQFLERNQSFCGPKTNTQSPNGFKGFKWNPKGARARIINGKEVKKHSVPWLVRIGDGDCKSFCGGSLIQSNMVLSAAHCKEKNNNIVTLGDHDCDDTDDEKRIKVKRWILHEDYFISNNSEYALNDIAIVILEKRAIYSKTIAPICLPSKPYTDFSNVAGQLATAAGWGDHKVNETSEEYEEREHKLMEVQLQILPSNSCEIKKEDVQFQGGYNSSSMMCVGDPDYIQSNNPGKNWRAKMGKIKSIWKGDSGGKCYFIICIGNVNICYQYIKTWSGSKTKL